MSSGGSSSSSSSSSSLGWFVSSSSLMPIDSKSALAFGPSFDFSGMLSRVANRLSHTFFVICMTSRLFGTPRMLQYGKSQKTDLVFHTFNSGSGAFRLELIFPDSGHFFQFFNNMSI